VEIPAPLESPPPLNSAATALALALVDLDTPLWLDPAAAGDEVRAFLRFHCGASLVDEPDRARFAVVVEASSMPPLNAFDAGPDEEPERSATLIVQVAALRTGPGAAAADGPDAVFRGEMGRASCAGRESATSRGSRPRVFRRASGPSCAQALRGGASR
jgi:phosphonate C-P lyase system protein PhnH